MRLRPAAASVAIVALLLGVSVPVAASADEDGSTTSDAVVALIDTGINPYHVTFRDDSPRAYEHPSTYLPGFPEDAEALELTLDETDWRRAVLADCERVWSQVEPGELYWFPGTKIVGAISFEDADQVRCRRGPQPASGAKILDFNGHGTMVASRAASVEYGACPECRIVAVQGFTIDSLEWTGQNASWIDAQSNSWGPIVPLWEPTGSAYPFTSNPEFVTAVEEAARQHLAFWASGNGALTRGGVLGHPTIVDPRMTPSIVMVGGHDSGYINLWPDFPPHVISDSCDSWAAYHDSNTESDDDVGGGTSGASPFAAGGAAQTLLEARQLLGHTGTGVTDGVVAEGEPGAVPDGPLADGVFTLEEWREVTLKTASSRPQRQEEDGSVCDLIAGLVLYSSTPVRWEDVPEGYPEFLHIGYGAVDAQSLALAGRVLRGEEALPDRSRTDTYFSVDRPVRETLHGVFAGG